MAAEGGDGAVEEGREGHHQVEGQRGRVLGQRYLQLDRLHILLVVISPVSQLSLPETQTFLQQSWNITRLGFLSQLSHLNQEQEEGEVGGDGEADVDLDGLDLVGGNHPGGHGDLAAVDCPEDGEEEEGEDDVDPDLHTEPELIVQLEQGLEEVELDEDEEDDDGDGAADGEDEGQRVEEEPEDGSRCGGGDKPADKYRDVT